MTGSGESSTKQQIARLEEELEHSRNQTAALISLVSSYARANVFDDPIDQFFSAPEAWELAYPVGHPNPTPPPPSDCVKRCVRQLHLAMQNCSGLSESEQASCKIQVQQQWRDCLSNCRNM